MTSPMDEYHRFLCSLYGCYLIYTVLVPLFVSGSNESVFQGHFWSRIIVRYNSLSFYSYISNSIHFLGFFFKSVIFCSDAKRINCKKSLLPESPFFFLLKRHHWPKKLKIEFFFDNFSILITKYDKFKVNTSSKCNVLSNYVYIQQIELFYH